MTVETLRDTTGQPFAGILLGTHRDGIPPRRLISDPWHSAAEGRDHEDDRVNEEDYWAQYPDTLTAAHVAEIIRISVPVVRSRLRNGLLPGHLIGGSWIMFKPEIRDWLNSRSNQPRETSGPADILAGYPEALTVKELIALFGKAKETLYIWLEKGVIPGARVADQWVVYKWQLAELIAATSNQAPGVNSTPPQ